MLDKGMIDILGGMVRYLKFMNYLFLNFFLLIFLDHSWLRATETQEYKTVD